MFLRVGGMTTKSLKNLVIEWSEWQGFEPATPLVPNEAVLASHLTAC